MPWLLDDVVVNDLAREISQCVTPHTAIAVYGGS